MKQSEIHYKTIRKQLHFLNKLLKLHLLKWISILRIQGLTRAGKNKICVEIHNSDRLNSNPEDIVQASSNN